jgi:hypothetical protein
MACVLDLSVPGLGLSCFALNHAVGRYLKTYLGCYISAMFGDDKVKRGKPIGLCIRMGDPRNGTVCAYLSALHAEILPQVVHDKLLGQLTQQFVWDPMVIRLTQM